MIGSKYRARGGRVPVNNRLRAQVNAPYGGFARLTTAGWQFELRLTNDSAFAVIQTKHFDVRTAAESLGQSGPFQPLARTVRHDVMSLFVKAKNHGVAGYLEIGLPEWFAGDLARVYGGQVQCLIFESPVSRIQGLLPVTSVLGTAKLRCSGGLHTVQALSDGTLDLVDHPDLAKQRIVDALQGKTCRCVTAQIAYSLHIERLNKLYSVFGVPTAFRTELKRLRREVSDDWRFASWQS